MEANRLYRLALGALALGSAACGSAGDSEDGGASAPGYGGSSSYGGAGVNIPGGSGGTGGLPPEQEIESAYQAPVVTGRYVWSANPDSGRIAVIDPETLVVRLAEAGFRPTELAALPGGDDADRAIVINSGSEDATVLRADASGVTARATLSIHALANAWAIAPSGRWAIAWTDVLRYEAPDPTQGFQDLTVIDLDAERAFELSVGYRPSRIVFDEDEGTAFVVTEPGLSVIELGAEPQVTALIELTEDPIDNPASRDVNITPDGALALVRVEGQSTIGFVDLATSARSELDLGAPVTDLDLAPDGARAYVVAGNELVVVPIPAPGAAAVLPRASFGSEVLRSVSPAEGGEFAVLYSNAFASSHVGAALANADWSSVETRVVDVKATVTSALTAPDGRHAIVLGTTPAGSAKYGAFAIVPAQMDRTIKVVGTDAAPTLLAFAPDGGHALLATRDDARSVYGAYLIELDNLAENFVPLSSPPLSVGVVASKQRGFVAELHPEGRITFVDFASGDAHTLTGFELAAKVTGQ
jgi:DNA-binding beta-propeller fold protein YncE